ncbi:MAG TPA: DUF493 domain-containing protein [Cellvibrionaceae bacterium]
MSQDPPKIEFPCPNYPIKVLGDAGETLHSTVLEVMEEHAPGFDRRSVTIRDSSGGRYQSVTVYITATGIPQLEQIHQQLRAHPAIKVVL